MPEIDWTDPATRGNPYPLYDWLREHDPIHWSPALSGWVLTRYADTVEVLRDAQHFSNRGRAAALAASLPAAVRRRLGPLMRSMDMRLAQCDPPEHTRIRALLNRAFLPKVVEPLRPRIAQIAQDLIDQIAGDTFDLITHFASPLPLSVICELLDIEPDHRAKLKRWGDAFALFLGSAADVEKNAILANQATLEFEHHMRPVIARRRAQTRQDLLSLLLRTGVDQGLLTEQELATTCIHLITASHETTSFLIGNGIYTLLHHPEAFRKLRKRLDLVPSTIEEILRFESPIQKVRRIAVANVSIGDKVIRAGQTVLPFIGAANRDPARFPGAAHFDIERQDNNHLAFGLGLHFCLGAYLARIEGQVALETLLNRFEDIRLAESPHWRGSIRYRGLKSLPVQVRRRVMTIPYRSNVVPALNRAGPKRRQAG